MSHLKQQLHDTTAPLPLKFQPTLWTFDIPPSLYLGEVYAWILPLHRADLLPDLVTTRLNKRLTITSFLVLLAYLLILYRLHMHLSILILCQFSRFHLASSCSAPLTNPIAELPFVICHLMLLYPLLCPAPPTPSVSPSYPLATSSPAPGS